MNLIHYNHLNVNIRGGGVASINQTVLLKKSATTNRKVLSCETGETCLNKNGFPLGQASGLFKKELKTLPVVGTNLTLSTVTPVLLRAHPMPIF